LELGTVRYSFLQANMAFPVGGIIGIIIAVIALIVFLVMWSLCYVVRQAEAIVIERFGRFHRVLKPGMNFIMPLADAPRTFTWRKVYIDAGKQMRDETITNYRIDLRESLFQFLRIEVYSKDTVLLDVSAVMFYRVVDVRRAIYDVQDLAQAVSDTAQSQLKRIFGGLTFAEAMQSQATINALMRTGVRDTYEKWGLQVERIELQDLRPKATSDTANAMKRQMIAERNRRSEFIHAEGNKAAMKLKSEGLKIVKANLVRCWQRRRRLVFFSPAFVLCPCIAPLTWSSPCRLPIPPSLPQTTRRVLRSRRARASARRATRTRRWSSRARRRFRWTLSPSPSRRTAADRRSL
jgi:regulator of protease activity HflC (stomatin/prohibitin superfamily)